MLVNTEDTNSEICHYRARSIIPPEAQNIQLKAHRPFNPRLGKYSGTVFRGKTTQELEKNPNTGGYDLGYADFSQIDNMQNQTIDLTNTGGNTSANMNTNTNETQLYIKMKTQNNMPRQNHKQKRERKIKVKLKVKTKIKTKQKNVDSHHRIMRISHPQRKLE